MFLREKNRITPEKGFTLLELLIVVAVMAVISASVILNSSASQDYSKEMAVRAEMEQLRQAVIRFFQDQNNYTASSLADIEFLLVKDDSNEYWNPDYRTGWRGPYIKGGDVSYRTPYVTIGNDSGNPENGTVVRVLAKPDPFFHPSAGALFIWTKENAIVDDSTNPEIERLGRPYYFFDLDSYFDQDNCIDEDSPCPSIVSSGPDGIYGTTDDLILII